MKEPVRVLIINHVADLGGAELMLIKFLEGLDRKRIQPTLLCLEEGPLCDWCRQHQIPLLWIENNQEFIHIKRSTRLVKLFKALPQFYKTIRYIKKVALKEDFDLVLTNSVKAHILGSLGARRLPVIWRLHDIIDTSTFSYYGVKAMAAVAKRADHISCVSNAVRQALIKSKVPEDKVSVLYNGIEDITYTQRDSFRREWGIMDHEVAVALIARLSPEKGHKIFIQAAYHLLKTFPHIKFLIVGGDVFAKEKTYIKRLKSLVKKLGISDNIIFTGHLNDIPKVLRGIDIFVNVPNKPDSLPTAIIEAMLAGKPIIASKIGGIPEMIEHGKNGLLIKPNDTLSLVKAIEKIIHDNTFAKEIGDKARDKALKDFNIDNYIDNMTALLEAFKEGQIHETRG